MGAKILLTVNDTKPIEIHTSCSVDIYAGMTFGNTDLILAGESHEGGPLCKNIPPDSSDCKECEGGITELDLQYLGDGLVDITVYGEIKGKRGSKEEWTQVFTGLKMGDNLQINTPDGADKLGTRIYLQIGNGQRFEIHTSCSVDIGVGMTFGKYKVLSGASLKGGPLCDSLPPNDPPNESGCSDCQGQITSLDIEYVGGESNATIKIYEGKVEDKHLFKTFSSVNNGDLLAFKGSEKDSKMGAKILLTINGQAPIEIHTSCSQDIFAGMTFGNKYLIVSGTSHEGGPLCEISADQLKEVPQNKPLEVKMYPNPLKDHGNIEFTPSSNCKTKIVLKDSHGRKVAVLFDKHVKKGKPVKVKFHSHKFKKGLHYLIIRCGNETIRKTISIR